MTQSGPLPGETRALIVAVERYRDTSSENKRPGTLQTAREIEQRLTLGGWNVRLLTDDASSATRRSGLTQILEGLEWLKDSQQSLIILSGRVRAERFYPADYKTSFVQQSTLALSELINSLSSRTGLILDGALSTALSQKLSWAIIASEVERDEELFSPYGPTKFMHSITVALNTWPLNVELKLKSFFEEYQQSDPPSSAYHNYSSLESVSLLTPSPVAGRSTLNDLKETISSEIPQLSESSQDSVNLGSSGSAQGGRFLSNGRFQLLRIIGEGGIGQVFLARDMRLNKYRAIKVLKIPDKLSDDQRDHIRGRMIQAVRAAQELSEYTHHVVQVYEVGIDEETELPFMVMEYLEGVTLNRRLHSTPALTLDQVFEIGLTLCKTLAIAHQHNVIHRDLKPENVMLIQRGDHDLFVKLLDFDLVKVDSGEVKTQEGQILGTLEYMSPEQLKGEVVDARADVFSLAAILYECFSGVRANAGTNQRQLVRVLLDQGIKPLEEVAPSLPFELCEFINRALSLSPDDRPQDAHALVEELSRLQHLKPTLSMIDVNLGSILSPIRSNEESNENTGPHDEAHDDELLLAPTDEDYQGLQVSEEMTQEGTGAPSEILTETLSGSITEASFNATKDAKKRAKQTLVRSISLWGAIAIGMAFGVYLLNFSTPLTPQKVVESPLEDSASTHERASERVHEKSRNNEQSLWLSLDELSRLPTPSEHWSDVTVTPTQDSQRGLLWVYRGGRLSERLSRLIYELSFKWRVGDKPREAWGNPALRWSLLREMPRGALLQRQREVAIPQTSRDDYISRRAQRLQQHAQIAEILKSSQGLIVLKPDRCDQLKPGDLITAMTWRVRGKRGSKSCEGLRCLNAHQRSLKRKKFMKLSLTMKVRRPEPAREVDESEWLEAEKTIKCKL